MVHFLKVPRVNVVTRSLSQVKLKVILSRNHTIVLTHRSLVIYHSIFITILLPRHNRIIGRDSVFRKEEVSRHSSICIKTEIITIFKVVAAINLLTGIDDWIDEIKIEGKLSSRVEKVLDISRIVASGVGKGWVVSSTLTNFNLSIFKGLRSIFALHENVLVQRGAQPLLKVESLVAVCNTVAYAFPMLFCAWNQSYSLLRFGCA